MKKMNFSHSLTRSLNGRFVAVLVFALSIFCASDGWGQSTANYTYSTVTNGSLINMASGTTDLLATGTYRDDVASSVTNIGFPFVFMSVPYEKFSINSNGQIRLGETVIGGSNQTPTAATPLIAPISGDNSIQTSGKVHYKVTGTSPNRILVIEWVDLRINFTNNTGETYCKVQTLLYETSGKIEFRYGRMYNMSTSAQSRGIFFSSGTTAGQIGQLTTISGTPTYNSNSTSLTTTSFTASSNMTNLNSSDDGSRRVFVFTSPASLAAPTSLTFTGVGSTGMTLNWTASSPTTNILKYAIYNSTDNINFTFVNTVPVGTNTYAATGLSGGTTYYWKVYAISEGAMSTALSGTKATTATCTPPSTQASIGLFTNNNPSGNTLTANWTRGNGTGGVLVVARLTSTTAAAPISGIAYTANTTFGSGNTTGTGNFVVYNGTGTTVNVTGLTASTEYTFDLYEYNTTNTCYKTPASSGAVTTGYCKNTNTSNTSYYISSFSTTGGTTNITNNASGFSTNGYGNFTAMTVTQLQNGVINFSITETGGTMYFGIWVDWNNDGDFDEIGENVYINNDSYNTSVTGSFTVPFMATPGNHRMRVVGSESGYVTVCTESGYTECEDYTLVVTALPACSGIPTAGTAGTTPQSICNGSTASMSVSGFSAATGITFQWQQSANGSSGWANVSSGTGATTYSYTTASLSSTTYYRCAVTCTNSSQTAYTNNVVVNVSGSVTTYPYTESFSSTLPSCWTVSEGSSGASYHWASTTADATYGVSGPQSGSNFMYLNVYNAQETYNTYNLTTSSFTLGAVAKQVRYYYFFGNDGSTTPLVLQISNNGGVSWTNIYSHTTSNSTFSTTNATTGWYENTVDLGSYVNQTVMFRFAGTSNYGLGICNMAIDEFTVEDLPACVKPTALASSAVTTTTATISWTAPSFAPSGGYQYEVRTSGAAESGSTGLAASGTTAAGVVSANITGLTANTSYSVYVRSNCGGSGYSTWAGPYQFSSACGVVNTFPWTETFETTSGTLPCWTVIDQNADSEKWQIQTSSSYAYAGNQSYEMYTDYNAGVNNDYLITPAITLGTNKELKFYYRVRSSYEPNDFEVLLSTTGTAPANFTTTLKANTSYSNTEYQEMTINLSAYTGTVYIAFHVPNGGLDGYYLYIDNVTIQNIPSCPYPNTLAAGSITGTSASLSWIENGSATNWLIEYGPTGFTPGTGTIVSTSTKPYTLNGLSASTTYDFYVRAFCSAGDTSTRTGPVAFTTACGVYTPTYTQDFTTFLPNCWSQTQGLLAAPSTLTGTSSSWTEDGFANIGYTGAARLNIYGTSYKDWLISPSIDLGTSHNYQLEFNLALTAYGSTNAPALTGTDDKFAVVISTDNGVTWTSANTLRLWNNSGSTSVYNNISNTGELVIINLSAYTGVVKIGLYGESTVSNADNDLTIDNFIVRTIPSCPQPSALTATNILPTQAQLSWTENGSATAWDIEYGPLGFVQGSGTTISATTNNPYTLTGLTASNTYSYYVRSKCGASTYSYWTGPFTFTTPCNAVTTFPWSENFEVLTIPALPSCWHKESGEWESTNNSNNTYDADAHNGTQFIKESYSATNEYIWTLGFSLTAGISYDFSFWWAGDNYAGWTGDVFYNTTQNSTGAIQLGSSFVTASTTTTKDYAQVVRTFTPSVSGTYYFAVRVNATITPWYLSLDDFGLELTSLCAQPTNINVSNITETTAVLNWTAASPPPASGYQYYCSSSSIPPTAATIPTGSTAAGVTTANITGLTMLTTYHVWVRSKCTSTSSSWIGPISFYTPDLSCVTALNFTGSSTIPEFDNGIYYFDVCNNTTLTLKANATPTCGTCTNITYKWQINAYNGLGPVDYTSNPLNYPINQASGYDGLLIVKIGDAGHVCEARYPFRIRSSGNAVINSISATINGCAGNSTPISIGGTGSQIQVTPHTSTFTASMGSGATTFIPDGPDCTTRCYESTVAFTDFPIASTITSAADILYLKMNLEHSFIGDVQISLVCPNGSSAIILQDYFNSLDGGLDNSSYTWPHMSGLSHTRIGFGSPGIADISNPTNPCNSAASVNLPGTGWDYCWSNNSAYTYASGNAYVYEAANMTYYSSIPNYRVNKSDVANRSNFYHPFQNFSSLIGCPLNGTWKVKVCDSWREDNGWIFNWELALDGSLMPSPWSYEVPVDHVNWNLGSNATATGPTSTNPLIYALNPSPSLTTGSYSGNFTIVDDYGCQSTAAINYTVNGIPAIAGIATDDYLWTGYNSIDWNGANKFNWMKKTATGYVGADFTPTSTSNVFVLDNCGIGDGPTIVDNVSCKNLTIVNGTLTLASGKTLSISGNLKNLSTFIVSPNSTVVFNGASTQTIQSGGTNFYNMQVNNSGSGLQLVSDLIVSNALTMNQGNINAGSYTLAIGTSTSSRGTLNHTSGAVFGKLKRWFASGTNSGDASGLFPVGNSALSTQYVPALIEYTASPTGGSLTAEVKNEDMGLTTAFTIPAINSCNAFTTTLVGGPAYWQFTPANGLSGGTYNVTLYPNGFQTINSLCELTALKRPTSGVWGVHGTHVEPSGTTANPVIKRTGVTSGFSDWGIGASTKNPLPIELLYFKAECKDAFVLLTWQTASEINNNYFTVEKSNNGVDFMEVKKINGAGNSNNPISYSTIDEHPYPGITYYRLKQTDYNGAFSYSDLMAVNCLPAAEHELLVYPNPFTNKINVSFSGEVTGNFQYCIYNAIGGKVICGEISKNMLVNNVMSLDLYHLSDGVYNLQLIINNKLYNTKIVK